MRFKPLARKWLVAAVATAGLQTAAIGWMVWDRIQLLRSGREVVLPVIPVDPRSLFRGDYVILSYEAQNLPVRLIPAAMLEARPSTFYVTLAKDGETWKPVGVSAQPEPATADRISLKGRPRGYWPRIAGAATTAQPGAREPTMTVRYGIESYFVSEGKGRPLEASARERKLAAIVAVDSRGNAAIKGLVLDGQRVYDEPLL